MSGDARDFDIDAFLERPLTARLATAGPTVRPVWYLWEDGAFWILTGPWSRLTNRIAADPLVALVVDVCDTTTGVTQQVIGRGVATLESFDVAQGRRLLSRYLGSDEPTWDPRFRHYLHDPVHGTVWLRLEPTTLASHDLSYQASPAAD